MAIGALFVMAASLAAIAGYEGYQEEAYLDATGVPTIGYGTTAGVELGQHATTAEAEALLRRDATAAGEAIKRCVTVPLHQYEYDAFVSLAYNIGASAFCRSTLVKKLNAGDYKGACDELPRWVYAGGQRLRGLEVRRERERKTCLGETP
jgi:lysozyme